MNRMEGQEKLRETSEKFSERLGEMEHTKEMGEKTDQIIKGIETDGLDSDTQASASEVVSSYSEAYAGEMERLNEQVESTAEQVNENINSLNENKEQVDRNAERYAEAAGVSDIGRSAAESGRAKMESDSQAYSDLISENEQSIEESRERSRNLQSIVSGLFG